MKLSMLASMESRVKRKPCSVFSGLFCRRVSIFAKLRIVPPKPTRWLPRTVSIQGHRGQLSRDLVLETLHLLGTDRILADKSLRPV